MSGFNKNLAEVAVIDCLLGIESIVKGIDDLIRLCPELSRECDIAFDQVTDLKKVIKQMKKYVEGRLEESHKQTPLQEATRSEVHPEIYELFVSYLEKRPPKLYWANLSTAHIMIDELEKDYPEYFSLSNRMDLEYEYGKNFMGLTFKKAVITVMGKDFWEEWAFMNSKASLKKNAYQNPKHFHYDDDGEIVYH